MTANLHARFWWRSRRYCGVRRIQSWKAYSSKNTILDDNHKKTIKRPKTQVDHCRENHRRLQQLNHMFGFGIKLRLCVALYIFRDRDPFELSIAWFEHLRPLTSEVLCNYAHRYLLTSSVSSSPMLMWSRALIRWISHHVGYGERSFLGGLDACANYRRRIRDLEMGRKTWSFQISLGPFGSPRLRLYSSAIGHP